MVTRHRVWVYGDNVNTDVIFPGKYTYTLRAPEDIKAKALEDLDPSFAGAVRVGDVIVAGRNWGCGSSREQAVTALKLCGVPAIVAGSFGGLYFRNCINQGIHPIVAPGLAALLKTGDSIEIDREAGEVRAGGQVWPIPPLPDSVRAILDAGGLLPMLQRRFASAQG
jgi:3-isopropylmalate/(R)-2-methylmalate dehydratase small subunit